MAARVEQEAERGGRIQDVLVSARKLFAEKGFTDTTMNDIADDMGIRAPSLYNHVRSKQLILDKLIEAVGHEGVQYEAEITDGMSVPERIDAMMRSQVRFRVEHPQETHILYRELMNLSPRVRDRVLEGRSRHFARWQEILEEGRRDGSLPAVDDARVMAVVLAGLCDYIQVQVLSLQDGRSIDDLLDWYSSTAMRIVGAPAREAPQR